MAYSHSRILHGNEKEPTIPTQKNMDESHGRFRQKGNILNDSTHGNFKNRQNYTTMERGHYSILSGEVIKRHKESQIYVMSPSLSEAVVA